jgi:hypothetical protein
MIVFQALWAVLLLAVAWWRFRSDDTANNIQQGRHR